MLNLDRVRVMSRLALIEKDREKSYRAAVNTNRRDYIAFRLVAGFVAGTVLFCAIFVLLVGALLFSGIYVITDSLVSMLVILFIIAYLLFMFLFLLGIGRRAKKKYLRAEKHLKTVTEYYDELLRLYGEEADRIDSTGRLATIHTEGLPHI